MTQTAQQELAADYGRDLCICHRCFKPHFNSSSSCPECGAGVYYQCWSTKDGQPAASHDNYAAAYALHAARLRKQAAAADHRAAMHAEAARAAGPIPSQGGQP